MVDCNKVFFELLQVSVGNRQYLSVTPLAEEWEEIYDIVKKQALVGVCFYGVKQLPQEQLPPPRRFRQWAVKEIRVQEKNARISEECRGVTNAFCKAGFDAIILKGQGNMAYYPEELKNRRSPGDIDVWAVPKADLPLVRTVIEFCQKVKKGEFVYYHNLDFPILQKTTVEVHYRPTWLFCPWRDRILQKWMKDRFVGVDFEGYKIPTVEFNVVFQLLHIYKHLFEEGIGLRQLLDYYFVLQAYNLSKEQMCVLFKKLGLMNFASAVMYVLQEVFGLKHDNMLCEPNEKRGRELLNEILQGGNFGHYHEDKEWELTPDANTVTRFFYAIQKLRHNMRFLKSYPMEVLFEPPFRVYHWAWRTFKLWRY